MNKQVLSVEQMQHLQELGLDINNASLCYYKQEGWEECYFMALACDVKEKGGLLYYYDSFSNKEYILNEVIPAYSLQDVLDALPKEIKPNNTRYFLRIDLADECVYYYYDDHNFVEQRKKVIGYNGMNKLIDSSYKLLVWCIENGYVKTNEA